MPEDLKIRVDVSPSLHPGLLGRHDAPLKGRAEGALNSAKAAMTALYREAGLIQDARKALYAKASNPHTLKALAMAREHKGGKIPPGIIMNKRGQLEVALPAGEAKLFNESATLAFKRGACLYDRAQPTAAQEIEYLVLALLLTSTAPAPKTTPAIAPPP